MVLIVFTFPENFEPYAELTELTDFLSYAIKSCLYAKLKS